MRQAKFKETASRTCERSPVKVKRQLPSLNQAHERKVGCPRNQTAFGIFGTFHLQDRIRIHQMIGC
jgi:hypothetical protein